MPPALRIFLDIETDYYRQPTVIGFTSSETGLVQLVGNDITAARLQEALPETGRLYTYNGHSFDLPCIKSSLGLDLRATYDSVDLRWVCQRNGITGGQKAIEKQWGLVRENDGMDGQDAMWLWQKYRRGEKAALAKLLSYNAEDIEGLRFIRRKLVEKGYL